MTNMRVDFREEANPQTLCTGASWSVTCVALFVAVGTLLAILCLLAC